MCCGLRVKPETEFLRGCVEVKDMNATVSRDSGARVITLRLSVLICIFRGLMQH